MLDDLWVNLRVKVVKVAQKIAVKTIDRVVDALRWWHIRRRFDSEPRSDREQVMLDAVGLVPMLPALFAVTGAIHGGWFVRLVVGVSTIFSVWLIRAGLSDPVLWFLIAIAIGISTSAIFVTKLLVRKPLRFLIRLRNAVLWTVLWTGISTAVLGGVYLFTTQSLFDETQPQDLVEPFTYDLPIYPG